MTLTHTKVFFYNFITKLYKLIKMCFHNSLSKTIDQLANRYKRKNTTETSSLESIEDQYHLNAFTNPLYPIITKEEEIQVYLWGLIPFWTKTAFNANEIRKMTYNAKAETIFEKASFKEPILSKRCLIPSTGYFEWRHEGKQKIPYYIYLRDQEVFSIAGIYDIWNNPANNEILHTFSLITTIGNSLTSYIHNTKMRMPVILSSKDEETWLSPHITKEEIKDLLSPFDANKMNAHMIDSNILKKDIKDKSIINKINLI